MAIDYDLFYDWCIDRFGEHNVKVRHTVHGDEITTHSFFASDILGKDDRKYHLWMNPEGGKKRIAGGAYRCWLTNEKGSLISLVSKVDGIDYDEAEELITGTTSLRNLEKKVEEFFNCNEQELEIKSNDISLPECCYEIDKMSHSHFMYLRARKYLRDRKLPSTGLYVCTGGDYENRIIIPYYDSHGQLIFYNGRTMSDNKNILRYQKMDGEQDNVLFMTSWPKKGSKIYIVEGEFDAITLSLCGLTGCACGGVSLSDAQIELLRGYSPVLSFDSDESGLDALVDFGDKFLSKGFSNVKFVRAPKAYKDWNKLLIMKNEQIIKSYIEKFEKPYNSTTSDLLWAKKI